ncbi:unnamed protein product [Schistosoma curassoni]|uniref:G_PROTEIN_RECEP_F1_2 domain-containing protein n=1 Tax=Schistosoma curassoni TaxID=6186 RepID=A0A183KMF3_9TREM|nr:unnamed protein product [Schistosoma curassoni]
MTNFNITQTNITNESIELLQLFHLVRTICMQGLIPVICIIGISTNSLNILILTRLRMRSLTNNYLLAVAVCDLFYGITLLLLTLRTFGKFETYKYYMNLLPYIMAFGNLCSNTACWLTCAFTAERYIAVSSPILARKICTKENCKWIILIICLFTFSVTLPDFLSYTVKWNEEYKTTKEIQTINDDFNNIEDLTLNENQTLGINNNNNNISNNETPNQQLSIRGSHYILTETRLGKILNKNGWPIIIIILVVIGPLIILSVFNGLLIKSIINASKIRLKMTKKTNDVVLPKIRYGIICVTESLTNYTRNNSEPIINNNDSQDCYSLKNSLKNYQFICKYKPLQLKQQKLSKQNMITGMEMHEIINNDNNNNGNNNDNSNNNDNNNNSGKNIMRTDEQDTIPTTIYRSYNSAQKLFTIHQSKHNYLNEKDRITLMLILIVVAFCVFTMPSAILHLIKVSNPNINQSSMRLYLMIAGNFVNLSLAINSTLNFFFYSWLSRRFRKTFYNLIKCN